MAVLIFQCDTPQIKDLDATLSSECELASSLDCAYVQSRISTASERYHLRLQYFATINAVGLASTSASTAVKMAQNLQTINAGGVPKIDGQLTHAQLQAQATALKAAVPAHQLRILFMLRLLRIRQLRYDGVSGRRARLNLG